MDPGGGVPTPEPSSSPCTAVIFFFFFLLFLYVDNFIHFDLLYLLQISRELNVCISVPLMPMHWTRSLLWSERSG